MVDEPRLIPNLSSSKNRTATVIVFGGTGLNFWHYFPIAQQFTVTELKEFAAIYGISGGAGPVWLRYLDDAGFFRKDLLNQFDQLIRSNFNSKPRNQKAIKLIEK